MDNTIAQKLLEMESKILPNVGELGSIKPEEPKAQPIMSPRTDAGNAELFTSLHEDMIRYNHTQKEWFIFNGQYWKLDTKEEIIQHCTNAARFRQLLSIHMKDKKERAIEFRWGIQSENATRMRNTLSLAKSNSAISTVNQDWHQDRMLLQFNNGTLDLNTQTIRDGRPEDMIYQSVGYDYDENAKCPVWEKAVQEIFDDNDEMVSFFQRILGYSLTGDTREHCLFILNGNGSNGKSVVLETIKKVLGKYAENSSFSTFEATNSSQTNDIARLRYARMVTASESGQSKRFNEERIKSITGGDEVTARKLYQEFETWTPQFKIWFAVNTLPDIRGTDDGIWRRIKVIPFNVSFKGREDKDLTDKLSNEIQGIMNWAVTGLKKWLEVGLNSPDEIATATKAYRSESDVIANFMEERVENVAGEKVSAIALYAAYREYCSNAGLSAGSKTIFGRQMSQMSISRVKISSFFYMDIKLKISSPPDIQDDDINQNGDEDPF